MAFEASSSSYASASQESVAVAAQELLCVLNTLNEKRKAKARKEQHFQQHSDPRLKREMPEVIESQSHKQMELSQIELIYRAEGNANLVLALPQFKKVLRLPKVQQQCNQKYSQQQQGEQQMQRQQQHQQRENQQDIEKQQEPNQILTTGQQQSKNSKNDVGILTMDHYVAYISIIRCLVGNEFVFEADIVAVPNPNDRDWINEHIKPYRPANRLDKEFGGHFGLLLPDATQLPAEFDALFSNEQPPEITTAASKSCDSSWRGSNISATNTTCSGNNNSGADTYAIEIKPKQGWLLPNNVNNLFDIKPATTTTATTTKATMTAEKTSTTTMSISETVTTATLKVSTDMGSSTMNTQNKPASEMKTTTTITTQTPVAMTSGDVKISHSFYEQVDTRCRYCCMQFLKVKQKKINQRSKYCPFDLYSGCSSRMFYALESLFACPQNNLRIFKNGRLIFDDQLSQTLTVEDLFSSDKLQLIKHLLVTCLLREYANERHETYAESKQHRTTAQETSAVATMAREIDLGMAATEAKADAVCVDVAGSVAGQPQSSVTSCKKQKFNTMPKTTNTFTTTTTTCATTTTTCATTTTTCATTTTTCATATTTITETEVTTVKSTMTLAKPIFTATIPHTSTPSPSHNIPRLEQINKAEVTCLPRNCVLQKILNLQLLAKINLQFMVEHGYGVQKEKKTYNIVWRLLEKFRKHHNKLTVDQLTPEEQYILAATVLDCSIMITFCEIENVPKESLSGHHRSVVHLSGKSYLTKVTLLDLDPKPDTHFSKYCQQTKQIMTALKDLM